MKRPALLVERQTTHGDFGQNAAISQELKRIFRKYGYDGLCDVHKEVLDMEALKMSRILSGHANFKDHWDDMAGYAHLGSEACK